MKSNSYPNEIPFTFLKTANCIVSKWLSNLLNNCMTVVEFPDSWKIAHINPIPKVYTPSFLPFQDCKSYFFFFFEKSTFFFEKSSLSQITKTSPNSGAGNLFRFACRNWLNQWGCAEIGNGKILPRANQKLWWGVWILGPCGSVPPNWGYGVRLIRLCLQPHGVKST